MVDIGSIEKVFSERLAEEATALNKPYNQIYVKITCTKEGHFLFTLCSGDKKIKDLLLQLDILKIKVDFMQKTAIVTHYLGIIVNGFAKELECNPWDINVTIVAQGETDSTACFALYKGAEFARWFNISELI